MPAFAPAFASLVLALGQLNAAQPAGDPALATGATVAGSVNVPWAAFTQEHHVVVRSFQDGRWTTQGAPLGANAAAPALDFAGQRRTVPVVTWSEAGRVVAARFDDGTWSSLGAIGDGTDPAVAGGATTPGTTPAPWVARVAGHQIAVARGVANAPWMPVGAPLAVRADRDAAAPDIAFAGPDDATPWVVWQEAGKVFAARAEEDNGFTWESVGAGGVHPLGDCAAVEAGCSLNAVPAHAAGEPRVAAGPRPIGGMAVPWVVWSEDTGSGKHAIFLARLIAGTHFEPANDGRPLTDVAADATAPDLAFSGPIPYVTWRQDGRTFTGHLSDTGFVADGSLDGGTGRAPVATSCPSNPLTADGTNCAGVGTPFLLQRLDDGGLFGHAYGAGDVVTGDADPAGHVTATADGGGAPVGAYIEYGPTTAYGSATPPVRLLPRTTAFAADLTGLPPDTTIHYRAVAQTDFGTVAGEDRTFVTGAMPAGPLAAAAIAGDGQAIAPLTSAPTAATTTPAPTARRPRTIPGALVYRFRWRGPRTWFTRLRLRGLPARAHVRVTCTGGGCPDGRVRLRQLIGRRLRPGAVIEIRLTKAGMQGVLVQLTTRKANDPTLTTRSL